VIRSTGKTSPPTPPESGGGAGGGGYDKTLERNRP